MARNHITYSPALLQRLYLKSMAIQYEAAASAVSQRFHELNVLLAKYSPTQPRVPGGSPDGGQWTSGSGASGINEPAPDQVSNDSRLSYPDDSPIINPNTGLPYPKPQRLDILKNVRFVRDYLKANNSLVARTLIMVSLFRQGGAYDYQRSIDGGFNSDYIDVTNYNYGVVAAAFGYSKENTLSSAGSYNRYFGNTSYEDITSYGISHEAVNNIAQGYDDYYRVYRH